MHRVRLQRWTVALGWTGATVVAVPAEAGQNRFSQTRRGTIVQTGNTLGLAKALDQNQPGTEDSIGTFISLDPASQDLIPAPTAAPWPLGTTSAWASNGSTANLTLPFSDLPNQVLYAELIWAGSWAYGSESVGPSLNTPITLSHAGGASTSVTPDAATALTLDETSGSVSMFDVHYYIRTADVTSFVAANGGGAYSVGGVPATQDWLIDSLNAAGWTLVVVVGNDGMPVRNLSVFVGGTFVDEDTVEDYDIAGFCTPPSGPVVGRAFISAVEGDADLSGDQATIAPTTAGPFATISGSNNPATNFFASQVNGPLGAVDTTGSFGTVNHDAAGGLNVSGGRQGWDVTVVNLDSAQGHLANDQQAAVLRTITTGDSFLPTTVSLAIDINAPNFTSPGAVTLDHDIVYEGDSVTMTVLVDNTGTADAASVNFMAPLPAGVSLTGFQIDGVPGDSMGGTPTSADLTTGVPIGTVAASTSKTLTLNLDITAIPTAPSPAEFRIQPSWGYDFVECAGGSAVPDLFALPEAVLSAPRLNVDITGMVLPGDVVRWTAVVDNDGTADATATTLNITIPAGSTYVPNSTTLNSAGVADIAGASPFVPGAAINSVGDPAGTVVISDVATVTYDVQTAGTGVFVATAIGDQDGPGPAPSVSDMGQVDLGGGDGDGDGDGTAGDGTTTSATGDGDGDGTSGDGDGTSGDGDGTTASATGDGDGDGTTSATGDGDGTATGDGDGDGSATGDGDGTAGSGDSMGEGSSGEGDSGTGEDSGGTETGFTSGGFDDGTNMPSTDGCGCRTADESPGWSAFGLFALLGLRRRRRREGD